VLARGPGSSWSARSLGAWQGAGEDERAWLGQAAAHDRERGRRLLVKGVAGWCRWLVCPGVWLAGWSHMHPSGACLGWWAPWPCHPGAGLLSQVIERGV